MKVIDISDPAHPALTTTINTGGATYGIFASGITISGDYAYIADESGFFVLNLANFNNIAMIAGSKMTGSFNTSGSAYGLTVDSGHAYVADGASGLQIIDITTPTAPDMDNTGSVDTLDIAYDAAVSGNFCYLADGASGLQVVDITDPANPVIITTIPTTGIAYAVAVSGDYAYVADWNAGIKIIPVIRRELP